MSSTVLVVAALAWEAREIVDSVGARETARDGARRLWRGAGNVWVLRTGMGPEQASEALAWAAKIIRPDVVVSTGCAGALVSDLAIGDVAVADEVVTKNGVAAKTSPSWSQRYRRAAAVAGLKARSGRMLSLGEMIATPEEKRATAEATHSLAVEMEAAAIAEWALRAGAEFAAARAIIDTADMSLTPEVAAMTTPSGSVSLRRVAIALARRPGLARDLVALGSAARRCRASLGALHRALLRDIC